MHQLAAKAFVGGMKTRFVPREYQTRAVDDLLKWLRDNKGNPCLQLPTGAGKSHIIAMLCQLALTSWPETKILNLTHVKELIEQNYYKMLDHWPNAPACVYSASMKRKELNQPIVFAGIQSIINVDPQRIGHFDLIIVDEAHRVNAKNVGGYRKIIQELERINPHVRVIGLTATPYRLGHGYITQGPDAIFDDIIEPIHILELVQSGYLSPLRSKETDDVHIETEGARRGKNGDFQLKDLQTLADTLETNEKVVAKIIERAGVDRRHWLVFATGEEHCKHLVEEFDRQGIKADYLIGKHDKGRREKIIQDFKNSKIKALISIDILTTGFDFPNIDLIAMCRKTLSPALYVQMIGRGMRLKSHCSDCVVLDFVGNIRYHGPITAVNVEDYREKKKQGAAPVKVCPGCDEIVHASASKCPDCNYEFPPPEKNLEPMRLRDDDIMGEDAPAWDVRRWRWRPHTSLSSGREMICIAIDIDRGNGKIDIIDEYLTYGYPGYAGKKAEAFIRLVFQKTPFCFDFSKSTIQEICDFANRNCAPPRKIKFRRNGKFYEITHRLW